MTTLAALLNISLLLSGLLLTISAIMALTYDGVAFNTYACVHYQLSYIFKTALVVVDKVLAFS